MGRIHRYFSLAAILTLSATLAFPAQRAIGEELPRTLSRPPTRPRAQTNGLSICSSISTNNCSTPAAQRRSSISSP